MSVMLSGQSFSSLQHVPVATFHTLIVQSSDADAINYPSGKKAANETALEWPSSTLPE